MQEQKPTLSDIAYLTTHFSTHIYPLLGFLSKLEAQGMSYDVYGPKTLVTKLFDSSNRNCFTFEELEIKEEGNPKAFFKSTYESFLITIPAIEAIWKKENKKPRLIIADFCATYAKHLAKKHNIPLLVFCSQYFMNDLASKSDEKLKKLMSVPTEESLVPLANQVEQEYGIKISTVMDAFIEGDKNISCIPKFVGEFVVPENENSYYIGPGFRDEISIDQKRL